MPRVAIIGGGHNGLTAAAYLARAGRSVLLLEQADHLGGDTDMVAVVEALLTEGKRRRDAGREDWRIPFRPDHGHELADDLGKPTFPGYPLIGRLRGLAELRGVMTAVAQLRGLPL